MSMPQKQTSYQRKQAERLQYCIEHLKVYTDCGLFAEVPSASDPSKTPYIVGINLETLYSTDCNCQAGMNGVDCIHCVAVDLTLSNRRDALRHEQAERAAAEAEAVNMAKMNAIRSAYEVRGASIVEAKRTRTCTCCGGNHATSTCWL